MDSRDRRRRRLGALLLSIFVVGCSAGPTTPPTASPSTAPSLAPAGGVPSQSDDPVASREPLLLPPLPAPTLTSADDIAAAFSDPDQAEQAVVSMLALLGVGIYRPDGSTLRVGSATSAGDFHVFEPEVRGLVHMLRGRSSASEQVDFGDFHAMLVDFGYGRSADELAAAYTEAYAARPDDDVSMLVASLGPIDVAGSISRFEEWLLLLDGFIPPNPAASAMAVAGSGTDVALGMAGWGIARHNVDPATAQAERTRMFMRLSAVVEAIRIIVTPGLQSIHEGHGARGTPMDVEAQVVLPETTFVSPFTGRPILALGDPESMMPVHWNPSRNAAADGSLMTDASTTGRSGEALNVYTPRQEAANGQGIEMENVAEIDAWIDAHDALLLLYGHQVEPYSSYFTGTVEGTGEFRVAFHTKAEASVRIEWTDTYDGVDDTITFLGDLTEVEHDPFTGLDTYSGTGTATGSRAGWAKCNLGIDVVPSGTSFATFTGYPTPDGTLVISAFVDANQVLSGISTAPMEVPLSGGTDLYDSPNSPASGPQPPPSTSGEGALCPHWSHGDLIVKSNPLPSP